MIETLRKSDSAAEKEVAKFLDKYFYPNNVKNFKRYNDVKTQMARGAWRQIVKDEEATLKHIRINCYGVQARLEKADGTFLDVSPNSLEVIEMTKEAIPKRPLDYIPARNF